jgi:hypothetical protein
VLRSLVETGHCLLCDGKRTVHMAIAVSLACGAETDYAVAKAAERISDIIGKVVWLH